MLSFSQILERKIKQKEAYFCEYFILNRTFIGNVQIFYTMVICLHKRSADIGNLLITKQYGIEF